MRGQMLAEQTEEGTERYRKTQIVYSTVINNLAFHCRMVEQYDEALTFYMKAWDIRHVQTLCLPLGRRLNHGFMGLMSLMVCLASGTRCVLAQLP